MYPGYDLNFLLLFSVGGGISSQQAGETVRAARGAVWTVSGRMEPCVWMVEAEQPTSNVPGHEAASYKGLQATVARCVLPLQSTLPTEQPCKAEYQCPRPKRGN